MANNTSILLRESPTFLKDLDSFYVKLDETISKGVLDKENARIYGSVDAPTLWSLLCKDYESLELHFEEAY